MFMHGLDSAFEYSKEFSSVSKLVPPNPYSEVPHLAKQITKKQITLVKIRTHNLYSMTSWSKANMSYNFKKNNVSFY